MAERAANEKYKKVFEQVNKEFEGKLFVSYKMPDGSIRHMIYSISLPMFKDEVEKGKTYLSRNLTSYGIMRVQKTKKGNRIKLEKLDLSKIPLETEDDKRLKRIFKKIEKSRQK